jgi:ketosteroid isomerase-like protein
MTIENTEQTHALVETFVAARDAGDRERVAEMVTDDVEYVLPRSLGREPMHGEAAIDALAGATTGEYFDLSTIKREVKRITVEGDVAAVEQIMSGTTLEGKDYTNDYVWIYELRDGKFARLIEHVDTLHAARTLGWL